VKHPHGDYIALRKDRGGCKLKNLVFFILLPLNELQNELKLLELLLGVVMQLPEVRKGLLEIKNSQAGGIKAIKGHLAVICNTVEQIDLCHHHKVSIPFEFVVLLPTDHISLFVDKNGCSFGVEGLAVILIGYPIGVIVFLIDLYLKAFEKGHCK
jgi:hypothetical protein